MQLLEPIMKLAVTVPDEFLGQRDRRPERPPRRRSTSRTRSPAGCRRSSALVPLAKLFDYADEVRSLSQGSASSPPHGGRTVRPSPGRGPAAVP